MYPLRVRMLQKAIMPFVQRRLSTPYISSAYFKSLCDFKLDPFNKFSREQLRALDLAHIVFCKSHQLIQVIEMYSRYLKGKTLIAGDSDFDFTELNFKFGSISRLFLQNSFISDGKRINTLPLGVENLSLALNGLPWNLRSSSKEKWPQILVGPASKTHPVREKLFNQVASNSFLTVTTDMLSPRAYAKFSSNFQGVACPRGNGEDTHRLWETLYRGSCPVVKENLWSQSLLKLGIPMILVSDWSYESLAQAHSCLPLYRINSKSIPALWTAFWKKQLLET